MNRDVKVRPSAHEALQHPWIKNGDFIIPRAIDLKKIEDGLLHRCITSADLGQKLYRENDLAYNIDEFYTVSMPDILDSLQHIRRHHEDINIMNI